MLYLNGYSHWVESVEGLLAGSTTDWVRSPAVGAQPGMARRTIYKALSSYYNHTTSHKHSGDWWFVFFSLLFTSAFLYSSGLHIFSSQGNTRTLPSAPRTMCRQSAWVAKWACWALAWFWDQWWRGKNNSGEPPQSWHRGGAGWLFTLHYALPFLLYASDAAWNQNSWKHWSGHYTSYIRMDTLTLFILYLSLVSKSLVYRLSPISVCFG